MMEDKTKTAEGAALWRQYREVRGRPTPPDIADALLLAAYLDGALHEDEAARLEARLAADPALLDELLALRAALTAAPEAAPAGVVARAQELRALRRAPAVAQPGLLDRLFGSWLRPAVPAFATLAVVLACAGAFELGRYHATQLESTQSAGFVESDVPVDLLLEGLL